MFVSMMSLQFDSAIVNISIIPRIASVFGLRVYYYHKFICNISAAVFVNMHIVPHIIHIVNVS